jgi:hypothetical protein
MITLPQRIEALISRLCKKHYKIEQITNDTHILQWSALIGRLTSDHKMQSTYSFVYIEIWKIWLTAAKYFSALEFSTCDFVCIFIGQDLK